MKKRNRFFALLLVLVLSLSLGAVAFAADVDGGVSPQATCSHTRTRNEYTTAYASIPGNATQHEVYVFKLIYCDSCKICLTPDGGTLESQRTESHTHGAGGHFVSSSHSGPISRHTYTYSGPCSRCNNQFTWTVKSNCTSGGCIDPQSLAPAVI